MHRLLLRAMLLQRKTRGWGHVWNQWCHISYVVTSIGLCRLKNITNSSIGIPLKGFHAVRKASELEGSLSSLRIFFLQMRMVVRISNI